MNKTKLFFLLLLPGLFTSCVNTKVLDSDGDQAKVVEMTFYPEPGYGRQLMTDVYTEQIIFSDSNDHNKRHLSDLITEGFDFDYEIGNKYTFKANKIRISNPPQDVSNIKYEFIGPLTSKKMLTEDWEEELRVTIRPEWVKFNPVFSEKDKNKIYDALLGINKGTGEIIIIKEIEGFDFERGHEYELSVKRITTAEPFSQKYELVEVLEKR